MFLTWGEFTFDLGAAPKEIDRQVNFTWPAQTRMGARPVLQSTGLGADQIDIHAINATHLSNAGNQAESLRHHAAQGQARPLVQGGKDLGLYVITNIQEKQAGFLSNGYPRKQMMQISFRRQRDGGS